MLPNLDGLLYSTSVDNFPDSLDVEDAAVYLMIVEWFLEACWYAPLSSLELACPSEALSPGVRSPWGLWERRRGPV